MRLLGIGILLVGMYWLGAYHGYKAGYSTSNAPRTSVEVARIERAKEEGRIVTRRAIETLCKIPVHSGSKTCLELKSHLPFGSLESK